MSGYSSDRRRTSGPQPIQQIMSRLMARRGYGRLLAHSDYNDAWERISGDLSSSSRPGQLKRGVLEIVVANSTVMQEMAFQKRTLLAQLRADLPEQKIRDLRFVIGALD